MEPPGGEDHGAQEGAPRENQCAGDRMNETMNYDLINTTGLGYPPRNFYPQIMQHAAKLIVSQRT